MLYVIFTNGVEAGAISKFGLWVYGWTISLITFYGSGVTSIFFNFRNIGVLILEIMAIFKEPSDGVEGRERYFCNFLTNF
jgi:hypothetical protein